MRKTERDLYFAIGHLGTPPEPLWLPWWQWTAYACPRVLRMAKRLTSARAWCYA